MISLAEPSTGKSTWCYNTELHTNGDSDSLFQVYTLVHKYQIAFTDIAGIRIFRLRKEKSKKISNLETFPHIIVVIKM